MTLPASLRGSGSSLDDFLNIDESRLIPLKQIPISFSHCPGVYGVRSFAPDDACFGLLGCCSPCTKSDALKFLKDVTNKDNYEASTCWCVLCVNFVVMHVFPNFGDSAFFVFMQHSCSSYR